MPGAEDQALSADTDDCSFVPVCAPTNTGGWFVPSPSVCCVENGRAECNATKQWRGSAR